MRSPVLQYKAPWPVFAIDWAQRSERGWHIALGSYIEEYRNKVDFYILLFYIIFYYYILYFIIILYYLICYILNFYYYILLYLFYYIILSNLL
jgi:hypothetical protein